MKGDFSKWQSIEDPNYSGVLQQQGRVLLDEDWNAQTRITNRWQDTAAQDAFGPGVAAVPSDTPNAFEVTAARIEGDAIKVTLSPGRVWADGILVHLAQDSEFIATYFGNEEPSPGERDAVVLEVWREEVNGFQLQDTLIEPALGGPDTTERVHTAMALRLLRLRTGEACENIRHRLQNEYKTTGRLTVSLDPTTTIDGDCPITESGGYTGFEHHLYRVELALVNPGRPRMFKWSQFNGGLVGRGGYHPDTEGAWFSIAANDQAIKRSGLDNFYLEVVDDDLDEYGHRRVIYGAQVVLNQANDKLSVISDSDVYYSEKVPSGDVFYRLWNGIEQIPATDAIYELGDGIRLQFNYSAHDEYNAGDFWTFQVRADLHNEQTLLNEQLPNGVKYHRVPLAELHWTEEAGVLHVDIEDCRRVFRPLTKQKVCCSYTVGREGDFPTIQEAVDKLPWWGGEICLLPGIHRANVQLDEKFNIRIKGCGLRTLLLPEGGRPNTEIFHIQRSSHIVIENLALFSVNGIKVNRSHATEICHNHFIVCQQAIHVSEGMGLNLHHNKIWMFDNRLGKVAVFSSVDNSLIKCNDIIVIPSDIVQSEAEARDIPSASDECVETGDILPYAETYVEVIVNIDTSMWASVNPFRTLGGIQIGSGSDKVKIIENRIYGGAGNGITLGSNLDLAQLTDVGVNTNRDLVHLHAYTFLYGYVRIDGQAPSERLTLLFEREGDGSLDTVTRAEDGYYQITLEAGDYRVRTADLNYRVDNVTLGPISYEDPLVTLLNFQECTIDVVQVDRSPHVSEVLAFTTEISILNNEILNMGHSGIGTPQRNFLEVDALLHDNSDALSDYPLVTFLARQFGVVSAWVVDLSIQGNLISGCLQELFNPTLLARRGEGGISLGICENLSIQENRIENNGRHHGDPVCGIYVSYAAQADISHNQVINNGPFSLQAPNVTPGIRGGVVLRLTMPLMIAGAIEAGNLLAAIGGFAARIHDNVIMQPVGQALTILALGPTSVMNNRFQVDSGNMSNQGLAHLKWIDQLAAAVLIINLSRQYQSSTRIATYNTMATANPLIGLLSGPTDFANNQTRLGGVNVASFSTQAIGTFDDLAFENNQSDVLPIPQPNLDSNTWLIASSVRASSSRFREPGAAEVLSLLTSSFIMNNTSNNQGDHCIIAATLGDHGKLVHEGNVVLHDTACEKVSEALDRRFSEWFIRYQ